MKADELISLILSLNLPEVDVDQYNSHGGVAVKDYAQRKAEEFRSLMRNSGLEMSISSNNSMKASEN